MNVTDTIEIPKTHQELIEAYQVLYNNYKELEERYNTLHLEHLLQKEQLADLRRSIFGQRRERYISTAENPQLELALGLDEGLKEETTTTEQITYQRTIKKKSYTPHSRHALPSDLPRVDHIIEPEEDVEGLRKIGEEITEELEYEPGKFYVNR